MGFGYKVCPSQRWGWAELYDIYSIEKDDFATSTSVVSRLANNTRH